MVHAHQVEETRHRNRNRDAKRARHYDGGGSKGKLKIQDKPRFKKRLSNQVPSNVSRENKYRLLNPKAQGGTIRGFQGNKSNCS